MSAYSFVTVQELKDYMSGIGLDADQASAMQDVLDGLQRQLERYCQRQFERKTRTETVVADGTGVLWMKATPVVSASAPTGLTPHVSRNGFVGGWAYGPDWVTVTYVGGLDPDGDDLQDVRLAILRVAAREATTRHDDVLDPNDLSARQVSAADRRDLGFTPDELAQFDRLRRRTVA